MWDIRTQLEVDMSVNDTLTDFAKATFATTLSRKNETPMESHARAARAWCGGDDALAQRLLMYVSKRWFMWASPVIMNAPLPGETLRHMPISCFLSYVSDTIEGLRDNLVESINLTTSGGGIGTHWGRIRAADDKSRGIIPHQRIHDALMTGYAQARGRRGSEASYLPVSHPDIMEFINVRIPTQGDPNRKCLGTGYHHGVVISDAFMHAMLNDELWDLVDPHTNRVTNTFRARDIWKAILDARMRKGEPYLYFRDTAYRYMPQCQKDLGLDTHGSNLCAEITLPTNEKRTAVCCLSSLNLELIDEWKDTTIVEDILTFLDNILTYFIENAPKGFEKAIYSAMRERAVGMGAMGWHALLQRLNVPFESTKAEEINQKIFKELRRRADAHDLYLGKTRGEAPDMAGTGRRFSHKMAIAPNATSANALGTSPGIEPWAANIFTQNTTAGSFTIYNPNLMALLKKKGMHTTAVLESITINEGSVQHLDFLTQHEKNVYKTARELDQRWVVKHAADRAPFVCQAQSVNVFLSPHADPAYVSDIHVKAWRDGVKSMYYLRSKKPQTANVASKAVRMQLPGNVISSAEPILVSAPVEEESATCVACEG